MRKAAEYNLPPFAYTSIGSACMVNLNNAYKGKSKKSGGIFSLLLIWAGIFGIIAIAVYGYTGNIEAVGGVFLAAAISFAIMLYQAAGSYEGRIIEIKKEDVYVSDDDGGSTETKVFAIIQKPDGKIMKLEMGYNNWKVGDYIVKKSGEINPVAVQK